MSDERNLQQIDQLFGQAYNKLGRSSFAFLHPGFSSPDLENYLKRFEPIFQSKYQKNKQNKEIVDVFIRSMGQSSGKSTSSPAEAWLDAINQYFQLRWRQALPEIAEYAIEFFLPPLTEAQEAEYTAMGLPESQKELKETIHVPLPYSVILDQQGEIDVNATLEFEKKVYLIKSKLAGLGSLNYPIGLLANKLKNFPSRPFFIINNWGKIDQIAEELVQRIFDNLMHYAYSDLERGLSPQEAKSNALAQLLDLTQKRQLEELMIFRANEDMSMELYVLELLNALREFNPQIKDDLINEYYKHVFISMSEIINGNHIKPGNFFVSTIREATSEEHLQEGHSLTLEIQSITDAGIILEGIKEHYKFVLSDQSRKDLLLYSTNGFELDRYFL